MDNQLEGKLTLPPVTFNFTVSVPEITLRKKVKRWPHDPMFWIKAVAMTTALGQLVNAINPFWSRSITSGSQNAHCANRNFTV